MRQFVISLALFLTATIGWSIAQAAEEPTWREVDPERLVLMELHEGIVAIELNPEFAPKTVQQFRKLVQERFYDGLSFYRVIDGFVAQGGDGSDLGEFSDAPLIDREFERDWSDQLPWTQVQQNDLFAPLTGFVNGFAVARNPDQATAWLTHCPGTVAMARNDNPDSSRTDFYIVIGQAPRYLDRNMNVFGRVIDGMTALQSVKRGESMHSGVIREETARSRIRSMKLASDIPEEDRQSAYVMDTSSKGFEDLLKDRRNRKQKFFHNKPPKVLDVCQVPMAGFLTK